MSVAILENMITQVRRDRIDQGNKMWALRVDFYTMLEDIWYLNSLIIHIYNTKK